MPSTFVTNLLAALVGGILTVAAFAFTPTTAVWIGLGAGCAAVVIGLAGFAGRGRSAGARSVDLLLALAGAWTIVASCVFGPPVAKWLAFADGASICTLGVLGLIVREVVAERELRTPYWGHELSDGEVTVPAIERTAA